LISALRSSLSVMSMTLATGIIVLDPRSWFERS